VAGLANFGAFPIVIVVAFSLAAPANPVIPAIMSATSTVIDNNTERGPASLPMP
jgi:hypothetical protein